MQEATAAIGDESAGSAVEVWAIGTGVFINDRINCSHLRLAVDEEKYMFTYIIITTKPTLKA